MFPAPPVSIRQMHLEIVYAKYTEVALELYCPKCSANMYSLALSALSILYIRSFLIREIRNFLCVH